MESANITVIEGEDVIRTVFSLKFVYKGSTIRGEYGCFVSGTKTLEEIMSIMNQYGMSPEDVNNFPSIVLLDARRLEKVIFQDNGSFFDLETLVDLLNEIHKDIRFTRLAIDEFDLLSGNHDRQDMKYLLDFVAKKNIKMMLTVSSLKNDNLFELCDNYIVVRKGQLPLILFS